MYGYDESTQEYLIKHPWAGEFSVPYNGIGHTDPVNWLNFGWFEKRRAVDPKELELQGLKFAVEHAHRQPPNDTVGWGLRGYEIWIKALKTGKIGQDGGGEMAKMVRECRGHAATFLGEIEDHFGPKAHVHLDRAKELYQAVADAWGVYLKDRRRVLSALERAYEAEQKAVAELEAALREIESGG